MPQRRTAIKDLRKSAQLRLHNLDIKTDLKKTTKKFITSLKSANKSETGALLNVLFKKIDKAAKRNLIHRNTAARRKSYFSRLLASPQ